MSVSQYKRPPLGIYLHIPYCRKICPYCDFVKRAHKGSVPEFFVDALCREIASYEGRADAGSVFLGGGTPSLLETSSLETILNALSNTFSIVEPEVTIEVNPDDVTWEAAIRWKELGVNRISLGVQSFDDHALRYLGRIHNGEAARKACSTIAELFPNWSMDLMFGAYPIDSWLATLNECAQFDPPHLATYGLTYEPRTLFAKRSREAVDDDTYAELYEAVTHVLKEHRRYEVSNLAKPGFESRHNLRYWHNEEYASFGPGAYSYLDGVRSRNDPSTTGYIKEPGRKVEALTLTDAEIRVETVIQHLRLADGLPREHYKARFGNPIEKDFGLQLSQLLEDGLLVDDGSTIRPTELGFLLNNIIGLGLVPMQSDE